MRPLLSSIFAAWSLVVAGFCVSCDTQSQNSDGVTDTNTNWLENCESNSECGGLDCLCGVCTRACSVSSDCDGLGANAECRASGSCEALCVAEGNDAAPEASHSEDTTDEPPTDDDATSDSECAGDAPSYAAECGQTRPGACEAGAWVCPPVTTIPCPNVECTPSPNTIGCFDGCGDPVEQRCIMGTWACPPPGECTAECVGPGMLCTDECGEESAALCVAGEWECPARDLLPCPEPTEVEPDAGDTGPLPSTGSDAGPDAPLTEDPPADDAGTVTDPPPDDCENASPMGACTAEGAICGGPCTDTCSFCNLLRCTDGTWQGIEVFPAPCFDCGDQGLRCDASQTYCDVETNETASQVTATCETFPAECVSDQTCACLQTLASEASCTDTSGGIVLEHAGPNVEEICMCSVTSNNPAGWCGPDGEVGDDSLPTEWVCAAEGALLEALNQECFVLATGAPRWCCPESFEPACE